MPDLNPLSMRDDYVFLDEPKGAVDSRALPTDREGMTVLAGQCPRPWEAFSLFQLTLLNKGSLSTDAAAAGSEEATMFFRGMNAEIEAALAESAEAKAVDAAKEEHAKALEELAPLEAAVSETEAAIAAASVKEKQRCRRAHEDASATADDFRRHVEELATKVRAAEQRLASKRASLRAEAVAQKKKELNARRAALREYSSAACVTICTQLIALSVLEKSLK